MTFASLMFFYVVPVLLGIITLLYILALKRPTPAVLFLFSLMGYLFSIVILVPGLIMLGLLWIMASGSPAGAAPVPMQMILLNFTPFLLQILGSLAYYLQKKKWWITLKYLPFALTILSYPYYYIHYTH